MEDIVMQPRCVYCKREQYAPAVYPISHGEQPCVWCGKIPPVFHTEQEYFDAMNKGVGFEDEDNNDSV